MDREALQRLAESYNQVNENIAQRQAERYKKALEKIVRDLPQGIMQGGANIESGLTGNDAAAKERERQRRLNDPKLRGVDRATGQQGVDVFGKQAQMTQDQESGRTNIPRTDAQGNRIYTDADRPQGYHTIKVDGKDVRRYWDAKNKNWRVDPDNQFQMGVEKPDDPRAREIRRDSVPGPKVFDMKTDENPLDTLKDQGSKAWNWITGGGPGPKDVKGLDDPLDLGGATGLKPQGGKPQDTNAQSTTSGMTPEELKAAQDKINQQRQDNIEAGRSNNNLPADYKETELEAGRNAEASRPGAGLPVSGGGNQAPGERRGPGGNEGLTDMQIWAKTHPGLAAKVKPGQAGYDEIQAYRNRSSSEASTPSVQTQIQRSDQQKKIQQAADKYKGNLGKVTGGSSNMKNDIKTPGIRAASKLQDYSQKMNNSNQGSKPFAGLPEEYLPETYTADEVVITYLCEELGCTQEGASAMLAHLSPEFREYILEDWAEKAGRFLNNAGRSFSRATQGKKIKADANPVHRAINAVTRGVGDAAKSFGKGLTAAPGDKDSVSPDKPKTEPKKDEPKVEPKNDTPPPKTEPKTEPKKDPKTTGSDDKVGGRLGKALDWASDPKNKDAWMKKEDYQALADAYASMYEANRSEEGMSYTAKVVKRNMRDGDEPTPAAQARRQFRSQALRGMKKPKPIKKPRQETRMPGKQLKDMQEGLPEPKVNYLKDMDPYDPRRSPRDHAPGSPLPPPSYSPGLPDMRIKRASKVKKPGNVKKA